MKIVIALVGAALGVGLGFALVANDAPDSRPRVDEVTVQLTCPEEDSCTPEYDGAINRWIITRP